MAQRIPIKSPLLSQTIPGETLYLYMSIMVEAVSTTYWYEKKIGHKDQSIIPTDGATAFALVVVACQLRPSFQAHSITIQTEAPLPLKKVLQRPKTSGRLVNCSIELNQFDIDYIPRITIKEQTLKDFVAKLTNPPEDVLDPPAKSH